LVIAGKRFLSLLDAAPSFSNRALIPEKTDSVLSKALITMFTFSAIRLTLNFKISHPFVKMVKRHMFCFFDSKVKAVSQGKQVHPRLIASYFPSSASIVSISANI
jgi:hypothetical protein